MKLMFIALILAFISCGENSKPGPEKIHYGQDICERCKMIISEERFSSQIITDNRKVFNFDDIGGMIHYLSDNKISPGSVEIYVKDYETRDWILASEAIYVVTEEIKTPMNFGIIAFAKKMEADAFISERSGRILAKFTDVIDYILYI